MHKSILFLESAGAGSSAYRAVIKTRHGRTLYLSLELSGEVCILHRPGPGAPKTAPGAQKAANPPFPGGQALGSDCFPAGQDVLRRRVRPKRHGRVTPGGVPPT